ncbi:MAG: hypothetical protein ABIE74_01550 [Pseudomonadota bacterium]
MKSSLTTPFNKINIVMLTFLLIILVTLGACGDGDLSSEEATNLPADNPGETPSSDSGTDDAAGTPLPIPAAKPADDTTTTIPQELVSLKLIRSDGVRLNFTAKDFNLSVPLRIMIEAIFNTSITDKKQFEAVFAFQDSNGKKIEGAFTWTKDNKTVFFVPTHGLTHKTKYTLTSALVKETLSFTTMTLGDADGDGIQDLAVGAPGANKVYIYSGKIIADHKDPNTSPQPLASVATGGSKHLFGYALSMSGDVNGDGYADLAVGAYGLGAPYGGVYIFSGKNLKGVVALNTALATILNIQEPGAFGYSIDSSGDLNGDGFSEIIVGTNGFAPNTYYGCAFLYDGNSLKPLMSSIQAQAIIYGNIIGDLFGTAVSNSGDVDGDGFDDLLIGARNANSTEGIAYLFSGSAMYNKNDVEVSASDAMTAIQSNVNSEKFGQSVTIGGDINDDGNDEIIIGTGKSIAYLYDGKETIDPNSTKKLITQIVGGNSKGKSVSIGPDINGDNTPDALLGELSTNGNALLLSGAYLLDPNTVPHAQWALLEGENGADDFGLAVSFMGDINNDGLSEIAIGAPNHNSNIGAVYIFNGTDIKDNPDPKTGPQFMVKINGENINDNFGRSVSGIVR